jgi:Winged helix DNA-binding domain
MSRTRSAPAPVLSRRALNRATLERQLLLRRATLPVADAVAHLVGLQSQAPNPPYVGLWTRVEGFRHQELSRLIEERRLVRIALMRSTIHLVTDRDCLALRPLVQPVLERAVQGTYGRRLEGLDLAQVAAAGRALVDERPRTLADVGALLAEKWPGRDPAALSSAVRALVPLVQVPPRGLWGKSGQALHTSAEAWLGRPLEPEPKPDEMVARYLAAFGPASVKDVQTWSGLTRLRQAADRLGPRLRTFRDEHGAELLDLDGAPLPDPDTPAPPRFLPEWDNLLLSHADRTRIVTDEHRRRIFTQNGIISPTILVDGFVRGTWKITRVLRAATLLIEPFAPLAKTGRDALAEEGAQLLAFAAEDADSRDVRFAAPEG